MSFLNQISPKEKYLYSLAILIMVGSFFIFNSMLFSLTFSFLVLLIVEQRYTQAKILRKNKENFNQVESLLSIYSQLKFRAPIPSTRGMAASPDFLKLTMETIISNKPEFIVELGSGTSTIIAAKTLEQLKSGFLLSIDHDAKFAEQTRQRITLETLEKYSKVITSELKDITVNGESYNWYDTSFLEKIDRKIELLIVDGPPRIINKNARFPAIPLLKKYFTDNTVILLDDGGRKDEQNTVKLWLKELDKFNVDYFNTEKGTFKLSKIEKYGQNKHRLEILNE